jgi:hypothetical protein
MELDKKKLVIRGTDLEVAKGMKYATFLMQQRRMGVSVTLEMSEGRIEIQIL